MHQYLLNDFPTARQYAQTKWWSRKEFYQSAYVRIGERINKDDGINLICQSFIMYGAKITTISKRLRLIKNGHHTCANCGVKLSHFNVEHQRGDNEGKFCLSPYATMRNGQEILLTWDHIVPRALGGTDHSDNSQIMCMKCNNDKGSQVDALIEELITKAPHIISLGRLHKALKRNKNNTSIIKMIMMIMSLVKEKEK